MTFAPAIIRFGTFYPGIEKGLHTENVDLHRIQEARDSGYHGKQDRAVCQVWVLSRALRKLLSSQLSCQTVSGIDLNVYADCPSLLCEDPLD